MKPTLHILSLPHTQLTSDYVSCAYTMKALKLALMMENEGYEVVVYGSEDFDDRIKGDKVTCITKKEQELYFGSPDKYKKVMYNITWGPSDPCWVHFNNNAIKQIGERIKPKDLILTFAGYCQEQVAKAFPANMTVEAGIGYTGWFSPYKVFESAAHQHYCYGERHQDNGNFYDVVIPNYWDINEFPLAEETKDYFLFVGRLIDRKGYAIAQEVCEKLGKKLILAGQLDKDQEFTGYGEHIGTVNVEERGKLMSEAQALFVPTKYLGPFEGVHAEALLCGTPVITTNFGVFTETVQDGFNGKRCDVFKDFLEAVTWAENIPQNQRESIRLDAQTRFGMESVAKRYDKYFMRLMDLYGKGWYEL